MREKLAADLKEGELFRLPSGKATFQVVHRDRNRVYYSLILPDGRLESRKRLIHPIVISYDRDNIDLYGELKTKPQNLPVKEAFKSKEFLGDKLLDVILADIMLENGIPRQSIPEKILKYRSNRRISVLFDKLGLKLDRNAIANHDLTASDKRKANAVEVYIWETFLERGYPFIKNLIAERYEVV